MVDSGRAPSGQALVASDEAPAGLHPSGFDPSRCEYRFSISEGRERHDWIISGSLGAINIWAEPSPSSFRDERWFGGIECHSAAPLEYAGGHHERCWLLNAECWHDGSSLQFSEQVEFRLPPPCGKPIAGDMLSELTPLLRSRYRSWLAEPASAIEARTGQDAQRLDAKHESAVGEAETPESDHGG